MSANFTRIKTWVSEILTASDLNAEFNNILNNFDPDGMDDASVDNTAMRATADPYPASVESLATDLRGELERLRYLIAQITGETYWYQDPDNSIANLHARSQYDLIWIPAGAMIPTDTNGAAPGTKEFATNDIMVDYLDFDTTTEEYAAFNLVMPENWDLGTIKAKFYWGPATDSGAEADTVEWEIAAGALSNDDAIDATLGTSQVISDAVLAGESADLHITSATPAITVGGTPALGDMVHFKVSRNVGGSDNHAYDARLFGVLIQIKTDQDITAW